MERGREIRRVLRSPFIAVAFYFHTKLILNHYDARLVHPSDSLGFIATRFGARDRASKTDYPSEQ